LNRAICDDLKSHSAVARLKPTSGIRRTICATFRRFSSYAASSTVYYSFSSRPIGYIAQAHDVRVRILSLLKFPNWSS